MGLKHPVVDALRDQVRLMSAACSPDVPRYNSRRVILSLSHYGFSWARGLRLSGRWSLIGRCQAGRIRIAIRVHQACLPESLRPAVSNRNHRVQCIPL